jgi:hypothetical protein
LNETYVRNRVNAAFRAIGVNADTVTDAIICPRCFKKIVPSCGRPDVTMVHPTARSCYVEAKIVKSRDRSFSFGSITPEQREWLTDWAGRGGLGFLALGVIVRPKTRDKLDKLYLVEWSAWLKLEAVVSEFQNSIPVVAEPGFSRDLQERNLDLTTQLAGWELQQVTGGWTIPENHPAHSLMGGRR